MAIVISKFFLILYTFLKLVKENYLHILQKKKFCVAGKRAYSLPAKKLQKTLGHKT